ncbi:response regulator transcription factor [Neobacillus sp. MER 74]|uniref:response regulator n=1 Tax=Neobacillus sp. MER 74 TaxID=2939566 RepID=UPI00203D49E7|nr:response regulator transcription factor [Neobacillus sp. MER 74]MCM3118540.1 response regulator transcription factor [Neobacillus sp. MER 74]
MIRIVIAEDQELLLGAMGSLLNLEEDMEVVGQASNGEEALSLVHQLQPDVCIMDIEMPEMSGLEAAEALKSFGCKVIILTTFARSGYYRRALRAEVRGFLLKDSPSDELANSIRSIHNGDKIYNAELIDEDPIDQKQDMEVIRQHHHLKEHTKINTVKNYLTTILDKIKLPTG